MKLSIRSTRPLLALVMVAMAAPALAQSAVDPNAEARLRKLEAEVRALQRQVFPGGDGKYFPAQVQAPQTAPTTIGTPATTPVTDLLARMDAVEGQIARLTAQSEENGNRLSKLEAQIAAEKAAAAPPPAAAATGPAAPDSSAPDANLAAMTGGASDAAPPPSAPAQLAVPPAAAAAPSATRLAAVKAIVKPQTDDPGDDDYSYGFRLWDAKFYPEAEQQLKLFLQKYPRHPRTSFARNLLGRAYLDDGNPREAAKWFLENYQADKSGARASDSLLNLAVAMKQLKDNSRACIALAQFAEEYAGDAAGRLRADYDSARSGLKCSK